MVESAIAAIHSPDRGRVVGMAARWGGIPLYLTVLLQGMPLGRSLGSRLPEDAQQQLVDRVTTVGATQSVLPALVWGSVYLLSFFLLIRRSSRPHLGHLMRRAWPLAALVVFAAVSVFWSPNIGKVLASSFHAVGITMVAMVAAIRCAASVRSFVKALSICFAANLVAHLACVFIAPDIGVAIDGRWMGMTTHSNSLGGIAWLGMWAATAALLLPGRGRRLLMMCFLVAAVVLYGSGSTTSLVAALVGMPMVVFLRLSAHWPRDIRMLANVAVVLAVGSFMVAIAAFDAFLAGLTAGFGKSSDFTGRAAIWQEAWRLIGKHPVLGWGFDDNARVIVETGFIHSGYHNGYLDLAVRGGAVSFVIFLALCWTCIKALGSTDRYWRMLCLSMGAAFLTHNFMEVSLFSPRNIAWVVFSTLVFGTALIEARNVSGRPRVGTNVHAVIRGVE